MGASIIRSAVAVYLSSVFQDNMSYRSSGEPAWVGARLPRRMADRAKARGIARPLLLSQTKRMLNTCVAVAAACILILSAAPKADGAGVAASIATVDGKTIRGDITGLNGREIRLAAAHGAAVVKTEDVVSITLRHDAPREQQTHGVSLRNGDHLRGVVIGGSDDELRLKSAALGEFEIAVGDIESIHFQIKGAGRKPPSRTAHDSKKDEVMLVNSDRLPGVVLGFGKESLTFDCSLGKVPIPYDRIRMVSFAAVGKEYKEPDALLFLVSCADGSAITGSQADLTDQTFSIRSTLGTAFSFPLSRISSIRVKNGRLVYLSDLTPVEVKETPLFDERPWRYRRDLSVDGNPITLRGKVYRKGLGVHSRCELTYDLTGRFKRFLCDVGIDDEIGPANKAAGGKVEVRVLIDGKSVFHRQVDRASKIFSVELDVTGRKRLTLVVDFGKELHINDHADWAEARLIR